MPSIKDSKRLLKRLYLTNLLVPKGLAITPLLSGPHGIGKTFIVNGAARDLGGYSLVVEGGSLKEGEITGLPFASPNVDGSTEVRFVPYFSVSNIMKVEKEYYKRAQTEGFLDGSIKLVDDNIVITKDGKETHLPQLGDIDRIIHGEINQYKFGEDLDPNTKIKLIESGEIQPVILFIDELNRTESQTMKELMNIILNRSINGYDLPWWVGVVAAVNPSSQNSTYLTNEMDDAQRDRFLKIKVDARLEDWIDYAFETGLDPDIVESIATAEDIFLHREKGHEDIDEMYPSPRSWEMVSYIYSNVDKINASKFFTSEEAKHRDDDLRTMINAKVGPTAGRTLLQNIENKQDNVKPADIINGKSEKVDEKIVEKIMRQKALRRKITVERVVNHIAATVVDFESKKKSSKAEEKREYFNYKEQIKHFVSLLDDATKIAFAKKVAQTDTVLATDGKNVFLKISDCFSESILTTLMEFDSNLKKLTEQK
jgi:MoxR-like ATPase/soluble cytochrome b562